ncbi:MAG TPA: Crp/Fnr family transcriptional regulator [Rhizobiales bacterium]|nr:cAMP-activated global transcriptional regulator CRP [bacterium BMS3Bbin10]HDO51545.1 Crp/Fnr family transcriptional regulator [Hyphomicrobiales bacterium]
MVNKDRPKHDLTAPCLSARARAKTEWDALKPDEIDLFNRNVVCRKYKAAQVIFHQGDPCRGLYFVESGLVAVRKVDEEGKSAIVRLAYQGDTLGYRPLLAKQCHRATAEVINNSRICFLDAPTMRRLLLSNPKLGMLFLEHTAQALGEAEERLYQVAALSVRTRIIHLLILLCDHYGSTTGDGTLFVELPITRRDLANMIGARSETVSRAFRDIQNDGLLKLSGRTVRFDHVGLLIDELHYNLH